MIPSAFRQTVVRMSITLGLMSITRILFYVFNLVRIPDAVLYDFLIGIWFDIIAIGIWFIPFYGLSLLPNPFRHKKYWIYFLFGLFHLTNAVILAFNLLDVEYYQYTSKRSTSDLFTILGAGEDFSQLIGTFITDFWWLFLCWFVMIFIAHKLYVKTLIKDLNQNKPTFSLVKESVTFVIGFAILFILGRGGLGYRPADMLTAAQYVSPSKTALVTNTPLAIIKTIGKEALKEKNYFSDIENHLIHNAISQYSIRNKIPENTNFVVIILESFGNEWLGKKTGLPFTPFLDSLLDESLYFTNGFANGRKSIEAMPAIFAGIPTLLDNPYISSHYGTNTIEGLPNSLKKIGYSSAFFHGATNGSMKFDEFSQLVGFEYYFGRKEYNNEDHCDDTWGVLDEYFNPWTARTITQELKEPFLAGLFTLSSHHPFYVPEEHRKSLPSGSHPIAQSIAYGDFSLRLFFEQAKQEPWFENTVFVICADHAPAGTTEFFTNRLGIYQIPIAFYSPSGLFAPEERTEIFSQIDIPNSILDLADYQDSIYGFGQSFLVSKPRFTVNYIQGTYHIYYEDYLLNFSGDKTVGLFNYKLDPMLRSDSTEYLIEKRQLMETKLKGVIQRFNHDLIYNKMLPI